MKMRIKSVVSNFWRKPSTGEFPLVHKMFPSSQLSRKRFPSRRMESTPASQKRTCLRWRRILPASVSRTRKRSSRLWWLAYLSKVNNYVQQYKIDHLANLRWKPEESSSQGLAMVSNTSLFVVENLEQANPELIAKTRGMNGPVAWDPHNPNSVVAGKWSFTRVAPLDCHPIGNQSKLD